MGSNIRLRSSLSFAITEKLLPGLIQQKTISFFGLFLFTNIAWLSAETNHTKTAALIQAESDTIRLKPQCVDFMKVPVDSMRQIVVKVVYSGADTFKFIDNGFFIPDSCPLGQCDTTQTTCSNRPGKGETSFTIISNDPPEIRVEFSPRDTIGYCFCFGVKSKASEGDSIFKYFGKGIAAVPKLSASSHHFPPTLVGDTATWEFSITNRGEHKLVIDRLFFRTGNAYSVEPNKATIMPAEEQKFVMYFTPQAGGNFPDTLVLKKNSRFGDSTLAVFGQGLVEARIALSDTAQDFGRVDVGDSLRWDFTITNMGNLPLHISDIKVMQDKIFCVTPSGFIILAQKSSQNFTIAFKPADTLAYHDMLVVYSNAMSGDSTITLTGEGCAPVLRIESDKVFEFNAAGVGDSLVKNFFAKNYGCDTLYVDAVWIEPDTIFHLDSHNNGIFPGESLRVAVKFKPRLLGDYDAVLKFNSNAWQKPLCEVPLHGKGKDGRPPVMSHALICSARLSNSITFAIEVKDDFTRTPACTLYYRQGGEQHYRAIDVTGKETAILPGELVTVRGIDYYFSAQDDAGNLTRLPQNAADHFSISIAVAAKVMVRTDSTGKPAAQFAGDKQNAYRLFSIPLLLHERRPALVLRESLGDYDLGMTWRFFDYHNGSYYELGENGCRDFEPGRAFWLIVNKMHAPIRLDSGRTVRTSVFADAICGEQKSPSQIALEPGWNAFGVPYTFPVLHESLKVSEGADYLKEQIWIYQGASGWRHKPPVLWPWEGYAIRADASRVLEVTPVAPGGGARAKPNAYESHNALWSIRITARCGQAADLDNFAGINSTAREEGDIFDLHEPPEIGDYVALSFPHPEWPQPQVRLAGDFRPEFNTGAIWRFEVKSNIPDGETVLRFENLHTVPEHLEIKMFDKNRNHVQNLRARGDYSYTNVGEAIPGEFELVVGTAEFIGRHESTLAPVPEEFELYQPFPNPFNRATIISFSLPQAASVWLKIYDLMGREVRVLSEGRVWEKGRHFVRWEGLDEKDNKAQSGMYFLWIRAGDLIARQKLLLLK